MEIAPGVYSLGVNKGFEVHAFLIEEDDGFTLIDTLFDADGSLIANQIRALGKSLGDLKRIILTHAHRSHLGGLATLKRLSAATVYAHEWEADIIAGERKAQAVSWLPQDPLVTYHFSWATT
ncbi:MAG: MBL fold metallo-hydrolase [Caldilineaceae bacterium]|nr:MBL fold metallo-hydrolase [Caldilineaceae bacterium]